MKTPNINGAGGTSGGLGQFFLGLVMAIAGLWIFGNQVQVTSGFWGYRFGMFGGGMSVSWFGVTLILFIIGVGIVFFNMKSVIGWALTGGSLLIILIGVIATLQIHFMRTSIYVVLVMLILIAGGLGLMARALKAYE